MNSLLHQQSYALGLFFDSMRVGLLIYGSLETLSGGYLYDRKLVQYLREQGDHVEVISLPWRGYARHLSDNLSPSLLGKLLDLSVDVLIQDELNHPSLAWLNYHTSGSISCHFAGTSPAL